MKTKTTTWTCIWQWSAEINWDANKEMLTKYDFYDSWLERWKRALVTLGRWWFPLPKKNTLTSLSAAAVDWGNSGGHLQGLLAITSSTILTCLLSCVVILVTKTKYNTRSDVIAAPDKIGNCENSGISGWKPKNCEVWIWEDCLKFRVCYKEVDAVYASRIYTAFATSIMLQSSKSDYLHRDIYSILFLCLNFCKIEYMFLMFTSVPYLLLFNVTE